MEEKQKQEEIVLTEEQKADLESKRARFRSLYQLFSTSTAADASIDLEEMVAIIDTAFREWENKVLLKDIKIPEGKEAMAKVVDILGDCTLSEVVAYIMALSNACRLHLNLKTKDWTVADLDIKLL